MPRKGTTETRKIGALLVRADFVPSSVDTEKRTVDVIFGTETPYLRYGWEGPFNEVLSFDASHVRMDRLNSGAAPLLDNHDRYSGTKSVLGVVDNARIEGRQGMATVRFSKNSDEAERVFKDVQDGILKGISVGYRVYKYEKEKQVAVVGQPEPVPTLKAIDWEPMEISIAPVPADYKSVVRNADDDHEVQIINSNTDMKRDQIIALLEKRGIAVDANATDEELLATLERAMNPTPAPAPAAAPAAPAAAAPAPATPDAARTAAEAERTRATEITALCRKHGVEDAQLQKCLADGTTVDGVRAAILEKFVGNDPNKGAGVQVRKDERDTLIKRQTDALVIRSGEVNRDTITADMADGAREFRHMTLLDMAKDSLERAGEKITGLSKMEIVGRAITSSSSDFPVILEGTNRRILLANYEAVADTWRRICSTGSVSDFRDHKRLRMGSLSNLDTVNENAEFKNKAIPDGDFEKISAKTKGNIINVSRQMIVNDDLNAFARLSAMLGRAAARSIEVDVYALLLANPNMQDGNPLFHSSHGNIGAGSALTVTGLDADRVLMAQQKDPSGNDFLDIRPSVLLVPVSLEGSAKVLNQSQYDPDANNKLQRPNIVAGLFSDVVSTARLTGTTRYLFADPNVEPVLEVAFLDGVQTPFLDSEEGFTVDGMKWKIRLDYGVGAIGWRGVVRNAGQ
jgi:phage head maturation protease